MAQTTLFRVEIRSRPGHANPKADNALKETSSLSLEKLPDRIEQADVYLIEGLENEEEARHIASELLADPVTQEAVVGASKPSGDAFIEIQPLPGVMDPAAHAVQMAIKAMLGKEARVQTGQRFDLYGIDQNIANIIANQSLANTVIQAIHNQPFLPNSLPKGSKHDFKIIEVPIRDLEDEALTKMSRESHLFLSLEEMQAIQAEYRKLGREPREIELETLAQTWSEHCVHKTLKANIRYQESDADSGKKIDFSNRPGHTVNDDGSITIGNLLQSTVAAATHELMNDGIDWCLSVFVDNAGIIAFDEENAVCFKCETHNHPSAIEPYGGAATGIGGCIRDIIGTGLAAKPIAATDIFCVAHPETKDVPAGCLHPRRILSQVVAGVRDYGNRMGIPTLNGAVWFDDRYVGNPLVYCGTIGVMPRDRIEGKPQAGDHIIAIGGRTGRDGIHGATFSSAELTDTHADEFSHAVQIGNPVTEKMLLDAILEARDHKDGCLFTAITDCGAGGFSSAVGEMGEELGATVQLENAPLKYEGLSPTEIWISEAQERMVLAVPGENIEKLGEICKAHNAEMCDLGRFGTDNAELVLNFYDTEVGRLPMDFLHNGIPQTEREAVWNPTVEAVFTQSKQIEANAGVIEDALLALLSHPNIASKRWIIRQYDHEVQGNSVVKPLVGPEGQGPSDAAVIMPVPGSNRGLAIANGLATGLCSDPYLMTLAAIDECIRNLVCVGCDPSRVAILDNFCWPSCDNPENLGSLVRAAEACYYGAKAYRTPFISGKDSLNNQFTTDDGRTIQIPPTLLISGFGIVPDVQNCVTMDAKCAGNLLILVGETTQAMGGSHLSMVKPELATNNNLPELNLKTGPQTAIAVYNLIQSGLVQSAHDCSEGGLLVAASEMAFASGIGLSIDLSAVDISVFEQCFAETPGRYLIEIESNNIEKVKHALGKIAYTIVGEFNSADSFDITNLKFEIPLEKLKNTWLATLDW